jgi:hypothetical protein
MYILKALSLPIKIMCHIIEFVTCSIVWADESLGAKNIGLPLRQWVPSTVKCKIETKKL